MRDTTARYSHSQDTNVSPNKQLEIYACKRFISPERERERERAPSTSTSTSVAIFIDTIGKNVCQVAADRLQMCAKCASCPHTLRAIYVWTHTHMNLQLELVVRSTRLSFKSRPSRWPNCKHSSLVSWLTANRVRMWIRIRVPHSVRIHIHIRGECVQLINWI